MRPRAPEVQFSFYCREPGGWVVYQRSAIGPYSTFITMGVKASEEDAKTLATKINNRLMRIQEAGHALSPVG